MCETEKRELRETERLQIDMEGCVPALMYSGRGSRLRGEGSGTRKTAHRAPRPSHIRRAGSTNNLYVTMALTGLPGNPKNRQDPSSEGMVAKVVGLPGFMNTLPKWIVPPSAFTDVFTWSDSPMDTPPETCGRLRVTSVHVSYITGVTRGRVRVTIRMSHITFHTTVRHTCLITPVTCHVSHHTSRIKSVS